jgi:ferredoxin-thioredoxin reductase catalytic subunit
MSPTDFIASVRTWTLSLSVFTSVRTWTLSLSVFTSVLNGLYRLCPQRTSIALTFNGPLLHPSSKGLLLLSTFTYVQHRTLPLLSSTDFYCLCPTQDFTASVLNGLLLLMSNTGLYRFCPQRTFTAYVQTQDFYRFCPYTGLYCFLSLFLSIMDLLDNTCQFRPPVDLFFTSSQITFISPASLS